MADPGKIAQFVAVTGVSEDAAKFYLDSSSGDLETAVNQFFATGGLQEAPEATEEDAIDEPPPPAGRPGETGLHARYHLYSHDEISRRCCHPTSNARAAIEGQVPARTGTDRYGLSHT